MWSDAMGDDKKEEKKSYTVTDKRGLEREDTDQVQEIKGGPDKVKEEPMLNDSLPTIDFATLIMSFASASMICMGMVADPATGKIQKDLFIAKQNIDVISLLKEKTTGNLTQDEEKLIDQILYELRMHYVEIMKEK
jgi:hypothetical protein